MDEVVLLDRVVQEGRALPILISWKYKWVVGILSCAFAVGLYGISNQVQFLNAHLLPFTSVDRWIPFLPWTVWIYVSGVPYLFVVYFLNRCVVSLNIHL